MKLQKRMGFTGILVLSFIGFFVFQAHAVKRTLGDLLPIYVSIQEALARDDLKEAIHQTQLLQKESKNLESQDLKRIESALVGISSSTQISDARKEFKNLSLPFAEWVLKNPNAKLSAMYCPMANAKWVQKEGKTLNPYYGKSMLGCGEKISKKDAP